MFASATTGIRAAVASVGVALILSATSAVGPLPDGQMYVDIELRLFTRSP